MLSQRLFPLEGDGLRTWALENSMGLFSGHYRWQLENTMKSEAEDLMKTLLFTCGVIANNSGQHRRRIADAYTDAQEFVASIQPIEGDARPRIVACLQRFEVLKAANDVAAAGWMLTAIQLRIEERTLDGWREMAIIANRALEMLSPSVYRQLH